MHDIKKDDFELVNCNYCNSDSYKFLFSAKDYYNKIEGEFSVVRCNNCGLVYTNPRPTKEAIHKFYPENAGYYRSSKPDFSGFGQRVIFKLYNCFYGYPGKTNTIEKIFLFPLKIWMHRDIKIEGVPRFKTNGTLLDIGCSYGRFLYKMKTLGWQVKGLEMNEKAVKFGKDVLGLDIETGDIDMFVSNEKFDVVVMRMVLEHVFNPKETLSKVYNLLNKSGIFIFSIPNFNGILSKQYKNYAYTLQLPTHFTHFTPTSIKRYLQEAGFNKVEIFHQKADRDLVAPLEYMKMDGKERRVLQKILMNKLIRKTMVKLFVNILSLFTMGSRLTIYAYK